MKMWFLLLFCVMILTARPAGAREWPLSLPRLHVSGNRLETPDGAPITLRGVSLCSLSWNDPIKLMNTVKGVRGGWNVNVVRLPVQPKEWERLGPQAYLHDRLDPAVGECHRKGLYCMIDWHEIADWDKDDTARRLEGFWKIVAPRYAGDPSIMYEIFNEPIGPKKRNRKNWIAYRDRAQKWVDQVRADAPDTVILIGSPHWSQMPSFAVQDPFRGKNLVYVAHVYGGWSPESWDDLFGDAAGKIPLFVSEWGFSSSIWNRNEPFYGTRDGYAEPLRTYIDARPQINWTAWSYDPDCGPAMLGKDKDMGEFVRRWLAEYKNPPPKEGEGSKNLGGG